VEQTGAEIPHAFAVQLGLQKRLDFDKPVDKSDTKRADAGTPPKPH
jgi:hypothetical protein